MKRFVQIVATSGALAIAGLAPAFAQGVSTPSMAQLIAQAGLSSEEAQDLTLSQIAALKFNNSAGFSQTVYTPEAGPVPTAARAQIARVAKVSSAEAESLALSELAAAKFNASHPNDAISLSRSEAGPVSDATRAQLIGAAGLSPAEAADLSTAELMQIKLLNSAAN